MSKSNGMQFFIEIVGNRFASHKEDTMQFLISVAKPQHFLVQEN